MGRLRQAVAAADYRRAAEALGQLRSAMEEAAREGAFDERLLDEVRRELEQCRRLALAARCHDAARLGRLRKPASGYGRVGPGAPRVRLEG
ncbi:MAG: hypothetical protein ACPL88_09230 [Bryobacteraceae bacterium]